MPLSPAFSSPLLEYVGSFVDGEWLDADERYEVLDPADGRVLATMPKHGEPETRRAVDAARRAMLEVAPIATRRAWLEAIAAAIGDHVDELARIITAENGKPLAEARGEARYAAGFYAHAATQLDALEAQSVEGDPRGLAWTVHHRPAGVAALITPWNFPLAMLAKKLSAALAGGCAVVVKPAELTPLSCVAFFRLLQGLGLPKGMVNLVSGDAPAIGKVLCSHDAVRVVSFTGSTPVGRLLASQAAPHLKRLSLELGGNAPFVVFADADLDHAADELVSNKFRAAGQTCVCTNRVLVDATVAEAFAQKVAARVAKLVVGPGTREGVDLGPLVDGRGWDKVHDHVTDALERGARLVHGALPSARPTAEQGWFFPPLVLGGVPRDARCMAEETFGPLVAMATFRDEADALRLANAADAGLAAYVFTSDPERAERVIAQLAYGHVGYDTATGPTPEAPFGGMRSSGYGREGGREGLLEYVEIQTVPHRKRQA